MFCLFHWICCCIISNMYVHLCSYRLRFELVTPVPIGATWCHLALLFSVILVWGWAASYQPPPQVADRGTTFRYGGQLRTKRTLVVWRISSGGPAAAVSSERGGGSRVALSTATKYPHALWRHCDMASLSRQKSSSATAALRSGF